MLDLRRRKATQPAKLFCRPEKTKIRDTEQRSRGNQTFFCSRLVDKCYDSKARRGIRSTHLWSETLQPNVGRSVFPVRTPFFCHWTLSVGENLHSSQGICNEEDRKCCVPLLTGHAHVIKRTEQFCIALLVTR